MTSNRLAFTNAGYFFIAIFLVALFGFIPSYFPKLSGRDVEFNFYTHLHAINMVLWLCLLIAQPFLIRKGLYQWHRWLGRASYILLPMVLASMVLMTHDWLNREMPLPENFRFYIAGKDVLIIGAMYSLAVFYRRIPAYHARLMIASSFQLLEPGLVRVLRIFVSPFVGLLITWFIIDAALICLVIRDRKLSKGKWIFRLALGMTLSVQAFFLVGGHESSYFQEFLEWFRALKLT